MEVPYGKKVTALLAFKTSILLTLAVLVFKTSLPMKSCGSQPISGTLAVIKSSNPLGLTMFAGDFKSVAINGNYFLNPDGDDQQHAELGLCLAGDPRRKIVIM